MEFCWRFFFWHFWLVSVITLFWLETILSLNPPRCSGCNVVRVVVQCCTSVLVYYNVLKQCWLENTSNEQEQRQSCGSRGRDWTRVSGASLLLTFPFFKPQCITTFDINLFIEPGCIKFLFYQTRVRASIPVHPPSTEPVYLGLPEALLVLNTSYFYPFYWTIVVHQYTSCGIPL